MVERRFCDKCGKQIDDLKFLLEFYDRNKEKNILEMDLCDICKTKMIKKIKEEK